ESLPTACSSTPTRWPAPTASWKVPASSRSAGQRAPTSPTSDRRWPAGRESAFSPSGSMLCWPKPGKWVFPSKRLANSSKSATPRCQQLSLRNDFMHESYPASAPALIEIRRLTRQFGKKTALDDLSLTVPRGGVFGLIGGNGAGKTTLIKHILGMLKAQSGTVQVFGLDPVRNPVGTLGRIGYLSEDRDLPNWMRVGELMRYTQAFFPNWDQTYAEELRQAFDLDARARIKELSRGQRARAGLLAALAHRPELLVLDEPSSGLDPVVRRDILGAIIRTIADEGRTVLFSSHLL